jgi:hypothetical protein
MKLVDKYRAVCTATAVAGDSILFWNDKWNGILFSEKYPRLHSFALDTLLSVKEVIQCQDRSSLFYLPLSQQAYEEFNNMQLFLDTISLNSSGTDVWVTIWKQGIFSAQLFYNHCFSHLPNSRLHSWIWKCKVVLRIKVFAWLLVSDRLNTRDMLRRRNWNVTSDFTCVLCPTHTTEDWIHLFFDCNFSRRIWNYLQIEWTQHDTIEEMFIAARKVFSKPFFTEVIILACWHIWKQRNGAIFENIRPSFVSWKRQFVHEASLHVHRVKDKHSDMFKSWIDNLL